MLGADFDGCGAFLELDQHVGVVGLGRPGFKAEGGLELEFEVPAGEVVQQRPRVAGHAQHCQQQGEVGGEAAVGGVGQRGEAGAVVVGALAGLGRGEEFAPVAVGRIGRVAVVAQLAGQRAGRQEQRGFVAAVQRGVGRVELGRVAVGLAGAGGGDQRGEKGVPAHGVYPRRVARRASVASPR